MQANSFYYKAFNATKKDLNVNNTSPAMSYQKYDRWNISSTHLMNEASLKSYRYYDPPALFLQVSLLSTMCP